MTYGFGQYMFNIGVRLDEFTYTEEIIIENLKYFKDKWENGMSPYAALTMLEAPAVKIEHTMPEATAEPCLLGRFFDKCPIWLNELKDGCIDCKHYKGIN